MKRIEVIPVFVSLLSNHRLSRRAALVYGVLHEYEIIGAYPSSTAIAEELSLSSSNLTSVIKELEQENLIHVVRQCGKRNIFTLLGPRNIAARNLTTLYRATGDPR